jgi:hypothetical protein
MPANPRIGKLFSAILAAKKGHIPLTHLPLSVGLPRTMPPKSAASASLMGCYERPKACSNQLAPTLLPNRDKIQSRTHIIVHDYLPGSLWRASLPIGKTIGRSRSSQTYF